MPRTVDPARHRARRLRIIDAGLGVLAEHGYSGATTAMICKAAGIGSGTFFHYFPTKDSLVVAAIELGTEEVRDFFAQRTTRTDHRQVLVEYTEHAVAELADPRAPDFIRIVGGLIHHPEITAALAADDEVVRTSLTTHARSATKAGQIDTALEPERVAAWIMVLLEGLAGRIASDDSFDAMREIPVFRRLLGALLDDGRSISS
ncbi:TetR/AcrR family transcriptional regulator [Nocardia brasiliensis]|uniref:TetR family transcriptional regulator n=1 Tax=Nocardia brasiliensis (strain ATCC 700358 / HUJEG-1) TaxID=1133849 RepID=K0F5S6_NOCB7|nr:TetR/AcrR family transcriptional regulator [Nocardia brasiliensis]AFU04690.1 TetR family transcriptional regulator [Nocardia brasiliensis ATCC 700358]